MLDAEQIEAFLGQFGLEPDKQQNGPATSLSRLMPADSRADGTLFSWHNQPMSETIESATLDGGSGSDPDSANERPSR